MVLASLLLGAALASASSSALPAQSVPTPQFRRYGVAEGLPGSNVYTVVQDAQGMLWIGTRSGLARYDGVSFRTWRHDPGDAKSLASSDVSAVLADARGRVWAAGGDGSGVNLMLADGSGFRHWRHTESDPASLAGDDVMAMAEDAKGTLWIALFGYGVDHMLADGTFVHLRHDDKNPDSLANDIVLSLHADGGGRLWIGTAAGLDVLEADGHLRHVRFDGVKSAPRVWHVDGHDGHLRASTSVGLFAIGTDRVARPMAAQSLSGQNVLGSTCGDDGNLWIGTGNGLYWIGKDGSQRHFASQPLLPGGQPGTFIWQVTRDHQGGLWLATKDAGLAYLSPDWKDFTNFTHVPDDADSLSSGRITSLLAAGDHALWVGGPDGQLDHLDLSTGDVDHMAPLIKLDALGVTALADAGQGHLWVGFHNGLGLFDGHVLKRVDDAQLHGGARWMTADAQGNAYASPPGAGVLRINVDTLKVTPLQPAHSGEAGLETSQLTLHDGQLWRASHAGLSRLDADGLHFSDVPGVAEGQVSAFDIAGDDLWLTRVDALEHYRLHDGRAERLARIDAAAGWPGMTVRGLLIDAKGRVWITAEVGLWRYSAATKQFRRFGIGEGLPNPEFSSYDLVRFGDGSVYTGTLGGVIGFHPATLQVHAREPRMVLTAISAQRHGKAVVLPLQPSLHLAWNDRELRVTARAMTYIDPARNRYRFRMSGLDPDWVDTGSQGEREFAGLGAGDFTLQVQGAGPSGAWAGLAQPLHVHVDAPPWARPWAWAAYVALTALLIWLLFATWKRRVEQRHRVQLVDQQRLLAEQASAAKTQFLATLGHEIRTPMTGVLGMAELLLHAPLEAPQRNQVKAIQHSGELLLKLVNDALDMARIEAGRFELDLAPLDPRELLDEVAQLEAGLAARKGLEFHVEVRGAVPTRVLGDALRIKQILLNLANNALKFTEKGGVRVQLQASDDGVLFRVVDTGPGISEASSARLFRRFEQVDGPQRQAGSGLGLAICRELTELMGGRLELESHVGVGSTFELWLPLPSVAVEASESAAAAPAAHARDLLLVEDDVTVAEVIGGLLRNQGHRVTHAPHGLEALSRLQQDRFDAVFLDLDLPGVDGFRIAQMLREGEGDAVHLPIIAVTARSGGDEEQRARDAGMDGFMRKPVTGAQLAAELKRVLEAPAS